MTNFSIVNFQAKLPLYTGSGLRVLPYTGSPGHSLVVPGSKSFTNRAIVLSGLCSCPVRVSGCLWSLDSYYGFQSLSRLGFEVKLDFSTHTAWIHPPKIALKAVKLDFGMAGTLARFFPSVILNLGKTFPNLDLSSLEVDADGDESLKARPLSDLISALKALGADIEGHALPFTLRPSDLAGKARISGSKSGQFLSGLLFAAAGSQQNIQIERIDNLVQPDYVRMTIQTLAAFGVNVRHDSDLHSFDVPAHSGLSADSYSVEADASTACYFLAWAFLHHQTLTIENLGSKTLQPDIRFVEFLTRCGAQIEQTDFQTTVHAVQRDQVILGNFTADFSQNSDQAITAAALALFANAPIEIRGVEHIRHHESDRIACLCENLRELNFNVTEFTDGFRVVPWEASRLTVRGKWKTHRDHRFAMVGFLLASRWPGLEILDPGCVEKTAPGFFTEFEKLGVRFQ